MTRDQEAFLRTAVSRVFPVALTVGFFVMLFLFIVALVRSPHVHHAVR